MNSLDRLDGSEFDQDVYATLTGGERSARPQPLPPQAAANRLKMADIVLKEGPEPVAWSMMPRLFAQCTSDRFPRIIDEVRQMVMTSNPVAIAAAHRGMAVRPDITGWLPEIRVPTLVICGEHDAISPAPEMQAIAGLVPGAQCVVIPNAGHMAPMEQPDLFNAAMRGFLG